jgi:hypothetical protein
MPSTARITFFSILAIVALLHGAAAQTLRGRVLTADGAPVPGALVSVGLGSGGAGPTVLTSPSGRFRILLPATARSWQVRAIGFLPLARTPLPTPLADADVGDIHLDRVIFQLADLDAVAGKSCRRGDDGSEVLAKLLDGARATLEVIDQELRDPRWQFDVREIRTRTLFGKLEDLVAADTVVRQLAAWPVLSIDPDTLHVVGFGRTLVAGRESTRQYYGPDARVLFSDWFLASHCFTVDRPHRGAAADTIHLRFAPVGRTAQVDVAGELRLDRRDLSLLSFSFTLQNLPYWITDGVAGGDLTFGKLPGDVWSVDTWTIRAPIAGQSVLDHRFRVAGDVTLRGNVTAVRAVADSGGGPRVADRAANR